MILGRTTAAQPRHRLPAAPAGYGQHPMAPQTQPASQERTAAAATAAPPLPMAPGAAGRTISAPVKPPPVTGSAQPPPQR
eukprot:7425957-Pyramimonas_sp.AAC.1